MRALGYAIAAAALLVTIPRYVGVFSRVDDLRLAALGTAILMGVGAWYILDAWADAEKRGVKRAWALLVVFAVVLAYEPSVVAPYILARLHQEDLAAVIGYYDVLWSVLVAAAPVVLSGAVVYAVSFRRKRPERKGKPPDVAEKASGNGRLTFEEFRQAFPSVRILSADPSEVAELANVTERTVRNWRKRSKEDGN